MKMTLKPALGFRALYVIMLGLAATVAWRHANKAAHPNTLTPSAKVETSPTVKPDSHETGARNTEAKSDSGPTRANRLSDSNSPASPVPAIQGSEQEAQYRDLVKTISEASSHIVNSALMRTGEVIQFLKSASQFFREATAIKTNGSMVAMEQNMGQTKVYRSAKTGDLIVFGFGESGKISDLQRRNEATSARGERLAFYPDGKFKAFMATRPDRKTQNVIGLSADGNPEYIHIAVSDTQFFSASLAADGSIVRQKVREASKMSQEEWIQ